MTVISQMACIRGWAGGVAGACIRGWAGGGACIRGWVGGGGWEAEGGPTLPLRDTQQ